MSQHDFNIANQSMPAARADINNALLALVSQSSGATAPATTYAFQWWYDTTTSRLKIRNAANTVWIEFATFDQAAGTFSIASASVSGLTDLQSAVGKLSARNLVINGSGRVNQRGYISGTPTTTSCQYTLDRWKVHVTGQSLLVAGSPAAGYVMTAPVGGVSQMVEASAFVEGPHVLNWVGTATASVNGFAVTKGVPTYMYVGNKEVQFYNGTFTNVQLEAGNAASTFENRSLQEEEYQCYRYYETGTIGIQSASAGTTIMTANFKAKKRVAPTITLTDVIAANVSSRGVISSDDTTSSLLLNAVAVVAGGYVVVNWAASSEL